MKTIRKNIKEITTIEIEKETQIISNKTKYFLKELLALVGFGYFVIIIGASIYYIFKIILKTLFGI